MIDIIQGLLDELKERDKALRLEKSRAVATTRQLDGRTIELNDLILEKKYGLDVINSLNTKIEELEKEIIDLMNENRMKYMGESVYKAASQKNGEKYHAARKKLRRLEDRIRRAIKGCRHNGFEETAVEFEGMFKDYQEAEKRR